MNWEFFYDAQGSPLIHLYRTLGKLRAASPALRSRESFFYNQQSLQGNSVLAYHRHAPATATTPEQYAMVALNFSGSSGTITLPFPKAGVWTEQIDASANPRTITVAAANDLHAVTLPSWYGHVYLL
jgi:maltooligosyltrehalose trehalohydrolase